MLRNRTEEFGPFDRECIEQYTNDLTAIAVIGGALRQYVLRRSASRR